VQTISTKWSSNLAYAVGLLATDGCLYKDGRHMSLTTKDIEQAENFKKCLGLSVITGLKTSGSTPVKKYYHVQFGSVLFYSFLLSIGLGPAKSKVMGAISVPDEFFFDYLRGCLDGDGCFTSYWDKRWKSSHMFYLEFVSASKKHIVWLQERIEGLIHVKGHTIFSLKRGMYKLRFAKTETLEIIKKMYYSHEVVSLSRKRLKIKDALITELERKVPVNNEKNAQVEKLVDSHP
jgi:hypothetical protein